MSPRVSVLVVEEGEQEGDNHAAQAVSGQADGVAEALVPVEVGTHTHKTLEENW